MAFKEVLLYWKQSPYQRIAFFTEKDGSYSLTLNDFWQFNSKVEHIYHECLFTMPSLFPRKLENVLVLGGGDGLGARELLKFPEVKSIDLIDLDPEIIKFAKTNVIMTSLNKKSFFDPKVHINVTDAKKWLAKRSSKKYDLVIVDFPDPTCDELWSLYTEKLYKQMSKRMNEDGVIAIQSSTYNTRTFDLIFKRLEKVFPYIVGYHTGASSVFCGFFMCSFKPIKQHRRIPADAKWITPKLINQLLCMPVIKQGKLPSTEFNLENKIAQIKNKVVKRPGNLGSYDAGFGKGAMLPPPAPPAPLTAPEEALQAQGETVQAVGNVVAGAVSSVSLPPPAPISPEDFFVTEETLDVPVYRPGLLTNPVVVLGIAAVVITPLLIKVIKG